MAQAEIQNQFIEACKKGEVSEVRDLLNSGKVSTEVVDEVFLLFYNWFGAVDTFWSKSTNDFCTSLYFVGLTALLILYLPVNRFLKGFGLLL